MLESHQLFRQLFNRHRKKRKRKKRGIAGEKRKEIQNAFLPWIVALLCLVLKKGRRKKERDQGEGREKRRGLLV